MKKLIVNKKYNEKKLNRFLLDNIPYLTSGLFYKTLRKKDIKINGKRINENVTIYEGDEILVFIDNKLLQSYFTLDIFFEDENILILDKPAGILSQKAAPNDLSLDEFLRFEAISKIEKEKSTTWDTLACKVTI